MTMLIRNAALTGYLEFVRSRNIDPIPLLRSSGMQEADLSIPDQWISIESAAKLLEISAEVLGICDLGFRLAEMRKYTNLGQISVAAQGEPDVRGVLELLSHYYHIRSEAVTARITENSGIAKVSLEFNINPKQGYGQFSEMTLWALYRLTKHTIGNCWMPVSMSFSNSAPKNRSEILRPLGDSVSYSSGFDGFEFDSRDLDIPNSQFDPVFQSFARGFVESITSPRHVDDLAKIRELIETTLPTGRCSLQNVAKTLGVNRATVHRLMNRNDTSFTEMVNTTRITLAQRHVRQQSRSLTDIARLLGFSELSSFSRWFRSEFGTSPSVWRADL